MRDWMWPAATLVLGTIPLAGCEPVADGFDFEREEVGIFAASEIKPAPENPAALKVMAYNIKFGAARVDFWFDLWGDRTELTHEEVNVNMDNLYALVREVGPDILMTEETDVGSERSQYVDMVQGFLENTDLNYAAYFQSWKSRYIPSEGVGRMDMGTAIYSRYPITFAERIRQEDRTDISGLVSTFYLHRMIGHAVVDVGSQEVAAYVVHTEAYDQDGTKQRQLAQIDEVVAEETLPFVLGGDFNELPPVAVKIEGFPDEHPSSIGTSFEQPPYTPDKMLPFFDKLVPWIPLDAFGTTEDEQRKYFSHSVIGPDKTDNDGAPGFWNRTLDYLFLSPGETWEPGSTDVLQGPGRLGISMDPLVLSDHAPVVGTWEVGP